MFRFYYAHENNILLDCSKLVCTESDLAKLKGLLENTEVIEFCSREKMNTRLRFYNLTNLTVITALLKENPMGCKNAVLPKPLLKNHTINCLAYKKNTKQPHNDIFCLFGALALRLQGTQRLEEKTSKLFVLFINRKDGLSPNHSMKSTWIIFLLLNIC